VIFAETSFNFSKRKNIRTTVKILGAKIPIPSTTINKYLDVFRLFSPQKVYPGSFGHLFSGRYKSLVVDERTPGYLRTACDDVHLNPVRAGLVPAETPLSAYRWSSYPLYVSGRRHPIP
jgi:hypothetical protein